MQSEGENCGMHDPKDLERRDGHSSVDGDWREPLYTCVRDSCACIRMSECDLLIRQLMLLGDYKDCPQILGGVKARLACEYDRIKWTLYAPGSSVRHIEDAMRELESLSEWFDTQTLRADAHRRIEELKANEAREREEYRRREARRKKIRQGILLAVGTALTSLVLYTGMAVLPGRLREAELHLKAGRYEEAYAHFESAQGLWHVDEAAEGMNRAQIGMAEMHMQAARYEEAITLFKAADVDEARLKEAYLLYSDQLSGQGRIADAISALDHAGGEKIYPQRYAELRLLYADVAADDVIAQGNGEHSNIEYARERGKKIRTLDPQLRFCRRLAQAGYDLNAVYPDGVAVDDAKLGVYQIGNTGGIQEKPDMTRVVIFERQEKMDAEGTAMDIVLMQTKREKTNDYNYRVKLLPGVMFSRPYFTPAQSFGDATAVVLLDGVYVARGSFWQTERVEAVEIDGKKLPAAAYPRTYTWYAALNSIAAYDRERPQVADVAYTSEQNPLCADKAWFDENRGDKEILAKAENRHGRFDMQDLYDRLDEALANLAQ